MLVNDKNSEILCKGAGEDRPIEEKTKNHYRNFKQIVNTFYNEEIEEINYDEEIILKNKGTIKLEPKVIYDKFSGDMKVEFKIGDKKMYKIKDLSEFLLISYHLH